MEAATKTVEAPITPASSAATTPGPPARPQRQLAPVRAAVESAEIRQARRDHQDLIWTTERLGERLVVELDAIQTLLSAILEELRARAA
jgi:hypothetical protein